MMARPLQVFSLLRLCASSSAIPSASLKCFRFASSRPWTGQSHDHGHRGSHRPKYRDEISDGEQELEDVEDKLQVLFDEQLRRKRTVKYQILKRQMIPSGPPQRTLTWDAIEQIRYLKREQPEEWTIERLAEGFSVTPDVISRILRSKFISSTDRKTKQDAKVMAQHNQQVLPPGAWTQQAKLKLPGGHAPAVLPSGNKESALISVTSQAQLIQSKGSGSLVKSLISDPAPSKQLTELNEEGILSRPTADEVVGGTPLTEDLQQEESWDGQVLTERELEEFVEMEKPPPAVQVGSEFFDEKGNFLYRL